MASFMIDADIPAGCVNGLEDIMDDPHLRAIGFFRDYDHPTEGPIIVPDTAYRFDGKSLPLRRHQPNLGEHNREVLSEVGFTNAEIDRISKASS